MSGARFRKVLVAEDEEGLREVMSIVFRGEGYDVTAAGRGDEALETALAERFDLVVTDVRLPGLSGIELLERVRQKHPETVFIVISAYGTVELAVEAMKKGAFHFLPKPFGKDALLEVVRKAQEHYSLIEENRQLRKKLSDSQHTEIIGKSQGMERVRALMAKIAPYRTTVLITGESGTGKELVARQIHALSGREGPFVAVNCAAIPRELLESELFGHVKGAFTGADRDQPGLFRQAHGGTLFLDEIGELPLDLQVKLLRVLQENAVRPVGGGSEMPVDVRVMAATSRDLEKEVAEGRFRSDLYYRLNVVPVKIPPLRERREDIPLLVQHFIRRATELMGVPSRKFSRAAVEVLMSYDWPGNVRELENVVEQVLILASGDEVPPEDLPDRLYRRMHQGDGDFLPGDDLSIKRTCRRVESVLIRRALERTGGNKSAAARILEISVKALQYKMKDYGIDN